METRTLIRGRDRDRIRVVITRTLDNSTTTLFADEVQSDGEELRLIQYREGNPATGEMTGSQHPEIVREYNATRMGWKHWQILL